MTGVSLSLSSGTKMIWGTMENHGKQKLCTRTVHSRSSLWLVLYVDIHPFAIDVCMTMKKIEIEIKGTAGDTKSLLNVYYDKPFDGRDGEE